MLSHPETQAQLAERTDDTWAPSGSELAEGLRRITGVRDATPD
ncbi:hypothetical protein ABZ412_04785 [Nocardia sp. NPDC005746]